jgi:hypothetical protein
MIQWPPVLWIGIVLLPIRKKASGRQPVLWIWYRFNANT